MANEKILNTRIQLKYDEYSKWSASNLELKKGEIALAMIETKTTDDHGNIVNVPTVVMKVGTGATGENAKFAKLPYVSALAADVHTWAKQSKNDFVNTFLSLAMDDGTTMQSKLDGVFATDAELASAVSGLQGELTTALANYYTKTEIDGMFETLRGEISDLDVGAIEGRVTDLETATGVTIPGLINNVDAKFADYTKTVDLDITIDGLGYAKVSELPTKVSDLENDVEYLVAADITGKADAEQVAKDITAAVQPLATTEALNNLASTHATDKQALEDAIGLKADQSVVAAMYTNDQIDELLEAKQSTIPANTYDAYGSATKALADANKYTDDKFTEANLSQYTTEQEVKDIVDGVISAAADVETTISGLTELVDYIEKHGGDASAMATDIGTLKGKVEVIEKKPAYEITAAQISNWGAEVGAKAAAAEAQKTVDDYATAHANDYTNTQIDAAIDADVKAAIDAEVERAEAAYVKSITTEVSNFDDNTAMVTVNGTGIHKIEGSNPITVTAAPEADLITVGLDAAATKTALGLGSAAYTDATAYATAAQGAKANSAVQSVSMYLTDPVESPALTLYVDDTRSTVEFNGSDGVKVKADNDATGFATNTFTFSVDYTKVATAAQGALADTALQGVTGNVDVTPVVDGTKLKFFEVGLSKDGKTVKLEKLAADNSVDLAGIKVNNAVQADTVADHAIGAHQTKACADYNGADAEVWVFNCGSATVNV